MLLNKSQSGFFILFLMLLSSCITSEKVNYMQQPGFNIPSLKVYSTDDETNELFNGSSTISQPMLSGKNSASDLYTYLIEENGAIDLPNTGYIYLEGKTLREANAILEEAIEPFFANAMLSKSIRLSLNSPKV